MKKELDTKDIFNFIHVFYMLDKEISKNINEILNKYDLTLLSFLILLHLDNDEMTDMGNLRQEFNLDSGTITPTTKRLEKKGLILRCRNSRDERKMSFTVTKKGQNIKKQFDSMAIEIIDNLKTDNIESYISMIKSFSINNQYSKI